MNAIRKVLPVIVILSALLPAAAAGATEDLLVGSEALSYGSLQVDLPPGWVMQYNDADAPGGVGYSFLAAGGGEFKLLLTALPALTAHSPGERCSQARNFAETGVEFFAATAVERDIPIIASAGQGNCLYRIAVTDRTVEHPTMENFKYVTSGGMATGQLLVSFTILHNAKDEPQIAAALRMLRTARHVGGPEDPSVTAAAAVRLSYPGRHWSLVIDASGMTLDPVETYNGEAGWKFGGHSEGEELVMSVLLEPALSGDDPRLYRKRYRKKGFKAMPVKRTEISETEMDGWALLWYTNLVEGLLPQPNVNAFFVRDAVWIDIHLSSTQDRARAHEMFSRFLGAVRFEE